MHQRMTRLCTLALGTGLALASCAHAEDEDGKSASGGNWFSHLFAKSTPKKKESDKDDAIRPSAPSPALVRQKAQFELLRRQEVCDKLRQIAIETGDKDLARKAEALEQRAWDLYVQKTGGEASAPHAADTLLDARKAQDSARAARSSSTQAPMASANSDSRAAARKDEP